MEKNAGTIRKAIQGKERTHTPLDKYRPLSIAEVCNAAFKCLHIFIHSLAVNAVKSTAVAVSKKTVFREKPPWKNRRNV